MRISLSTLSATTCRFAAGLLLLLAGCGSHPKANPVSAADEFLQLVRQGFAQQAYDSTAFAFQAQRSFKGFEATLADLGLRDFTSAAWTRKVIGVTDAKLDGEIVTAQKGKVLIAVVMTKEDGGWKLYALRTPTGDNLVFTENKFTMLGRNASFIDAANKTPPPESQIKELVSESLLKFNSAIQMENFSEFYNYVSVAWQSQLLERQLQRAFQPFIDHGMNIDSIKNLEPVFDEPAKINSNGILIVKGHYPTEPLCAVFSLKYIYELPQWKLYGIEVSLVKTTPGPQMRGAPKMSEP